jgi:hypothetical protein
MVAMLSSLLHYRIDPNVPDRECAKLKENCKDIAHGTLESTESAWSSETVMNSRVSIEHRKCGQALYGALRAHSQQKSNQPEVRMRLTNVVVGPLAVQAVGVQGDDMLNGHGSMCTTCVCWPMASLKQTHLVECRGLELSEEPFGVLYFRLV